MAMRLLIAPVALLAIAIASPAAAQVGAEANIDHADGHNGGEIGAGYAFGFGGFSLTPGLGMQFSDHHNHLYGRLEAAYQIPLSVRVGAGVRVTDDHTRPYGTVAFPVLPKLRLKGNLGPKYYAFGLTLGY